MAKRTVKSIHRAKKDKRDEYLTLISDIESEVKHYKDYFKGAVIICNCDNENSNFYKHFLKKFDSYGLKKLIITGLPLNGVAHKIEVYSKDKIIKTPLKGDNEYGGGDFRSKECLEALREADIVITNPPFSLFREYLETIISHNKKFLLVGNNNAITYKNIFLRILENKLWLGVDNKMAKWFEVPSHYEANSTSCEKIENGKKYLHVAIFWYTNLLHERRKNEKLILTSTYKDVRGNVLYDTFDNTDIINVDRTDNIPMDYEKPIGVPITFLNKYNPNQFEILGMADGTIGSFYGDKNYACTCYVNGKKKYKRIIIVNKNPVKPLSK